MALAADGATAFIVNANFDQRFNTSWLTRVDVPNLVRAARTGTDPSVAVSQGLHVPSLGGDLVLSHDHNRAYLAHRGSGLLTTMDVVHDATGSLQLSCGTPGDGEDMNHAEAHTQCDRAHLFRLREAVATKDGTLKDPNIRRYDDPYAVAALPHENGTTLFVGYLQASRISILEDPKSSHDANDVLQVRGYLRTPAQGMARLATSKQGLVLGASRAAMTPSMDEATQRSYLVGAQAPLVGGSFDTTAAGKVGGLAAQSFPLSLALGGTQPGAGTGADISGVVISPKDPNRLFVLSHMPDALTALRLDLPPYTTLDDAGTVQVQTNLLAFTLLDAQSVAHSTLSDVAYISRDAGDLLVTTSLTQDMVYFFDPTGDDLQLVHRMHLPQGQGPVALLHAVVDGRDVLLVSTFFDHGLTVLDIASANFSDFFVLASLHDENFPVAPRVR
jgi:hypothetical protein